jgi:hypothetical protein
LQDPRWSETPRLTELRRGQVGLRAILCARVSFGGSGGVLLAGYVAGPPSCRT